MYNCLQLDFFVFLQTSLQLLTLFYILLKDLSRTLQLNQISSVTNVKSLRTRIEIKKEREKRKVVFLKRKSQSSVY